MLAQCVSHTGPTTHVARPVTHIFKTFTGAVFEQSHGNGQQSTRYQIALSVRSCMSNRPSCPHSSRSIVAVTHSLTLGTADWLYGKQKIYISSQNNREWFHVVRRWYGGISTFSLAAYARISTRQHNHCFKAAHLLDVRKKSAIISQFSFHESHIHTQTSLVPVVRGQHFLLGNDDERSRRLPIRSTITSFRQRRIPHARNYPSKTPQTLLLAGMSALYYTQPYCYLSSSYLCTPWHIAVNRSQSIGSFRLPLAR